MASISDFLCRSSPRSSGRHAYLHCTYFLNVENVAGVVGKANNRVTVTTCLLTRDKWQKQEKKKEKRKKREKKEEEEEREGKSTGGCTGSEQRGVGDREKGKVRKGKTRTRKRDHGGGKKEEERVREAKIQSAARPFG